ncbi:MAG: ferredoxin [Candidatus Binatia bacterium]
MKVVVDYDLCEANAVCVRLSPEVFEVDDDDNLNVLVEAPGPDLLAGVEKAVRSCPRRAIKLLDD